LKTTSVYVTHDQVEAMTMADRIVVLNKGEIEQVGTPLELYGSPASRFVASFLGSPPMNFLPVKMEEGRIDLLNGQYLHHNGPARGSADLGIRPENLRIVLDPDTAVVSGEVSLLEPLGADTLITLQAPRVKLIVRVIGISSLRVGERVGVTWNANDHHLFDGLSGQRLT
jgi:ABC-type sugar transport system ATPase subunit